MVPLSKWSSLPESPRGHVLSVLVLARRPRSPPLTKKIAGTKLCARHMEFKLSSNLVPRAHVPFDQHQDTVLWNNRHVCKTSAHAQGLYF